MIQYPVLEGLPVGRIVVGIFAGDNIGLGNHIADKLHAVVSGNRIFCVRIRPHHRFSSLKIKWQFRVTIGPATFSSGFVLPPGFETPLPAISVVRRNQVSPAC